MKLKDAEVLRWAAFLPAAVGSYALAAIGFELLGIIQRRLTPEDCQTIFMCEPYWRSTALSFAPAYFFVRGGAKTAPHYHELVALFLAALIFILVGFVSASPYFFPGKRADPMFLVIISLGATALGGGIAAAQEFLDMHNKVAKGYGHDLRDGTL